MNTINNFSVKELDISKLDWDERDMLWDKCRRSVCGLFNFGFDFTDTLKHEFISKFINEGLLPDIPDGDDGLEYGDWLANAYSFAEENITVEMVNQWFKDNNMPYIVATERIDETGNRYFDFVFDVIKRDNDVKNIMKYIWRLSK